MSADTTLRLQQHWQQLLHASQVPRERGEQAFADVCHAYAQKHRYYHTLAHLDHMLGLLYDSDNTEPEALWATWYHDFVYRPGRSDNERRSAESARSALSSMQVAERTVQRTTQIILATLIQAMSRATRRSKRRSLPLLLLFVPEGRLPARTGTRASVGRCVCDQRVVAASHGSTSARCGASSAVNCSSVIPATSA